MTRRQRQRGTQSTGSNEKRTYVKRWDSTAQLEREDIRDLEEEQWIKVQGKKMKAIYEDIERMADTLRRLVDEVTFLRGQPEQKQARHTRRDPNPWDPLSRRAANCTPRTIGNQLPPSRNTSVDTRDNDTKNK